MAERCAHGEGIGCKSRRQNAGKNKEKPSVEKTVKRKRKRNRCRNLPKAESSIKYKNEKK